MKMDQFILMLDISHAAFHTMDDPGPDDPVVVVTLHERDLLLIGMALPSLEAVFYHGTGMTCFNEASKDLQSRLLELVRAQNPDWTTTGREAGTEEA